MPNDPPKKHDPLAGPNILKSTTFRDSIPTATSTGERVWVYPKQPPTGKTAAKGLFNFYRARTWFSNTLLLILFIGPFIRINGNPLLMFNIIERKFSIFGKMFWPQDTFIFAIAMVILFIIVAMGTAVFGRIWCGWLCPQTVLMEMLFRKIEYLIEGDANEQRKLNKAPWDKKKLLKKSAKHLLFFGFSFLISNLLLAYVIGSDRLIEIITAPPPAHLKGLIIMGLFTAVFYGIFARFREQACTFICPYGRFQSVMLDENSIVVAYDHIRGENRAPLRKKQSLQERKNAQLGDCINCNQCVQVCPTGIDIRNGTQMECVNCTACIDACNNIMYKIGLPTGLIRYASLNNIEKKQPFKFTPRLAIYTFVLIALGTLLSVLMITRGDITAKMLRTPGTLYQELPDGHIGNLFSVRILNKTKKQIDLTLKIEQGIGTANFAGNIVHAPPEDLIQSAALIQIQRKNIHAPRIPLLLGLYHGDKRIQKINIEFISPQNLSKSSP